MVTFPSLEHLRERRSAKWTTYEADVLPMPIAELDVDLFGPIKDALHAAVDRSDTGYPGTIPGMIDAFVGFAGRRWGWEIDPAGVAPTTDISVGTVALLRAACRRGRGVAISSPVYPPFHHWPEEAGDLRLVEVPLLLDERGGELSPEPSARLDIDALEREFATGEIDAYVLCNPENPLGAVFDREQLVALAEIADRHEVLVIADEVHAPLTLPGHEFVPYLTVSEAARRTGVALHSASKAWNVAGLRSALTVTAHEAVRTRLAGLHAGYLGHFGVLAGEIAFREGEPWLNDLVKILADNHLALREQLPSAVPGARVFPAQAGYLAWVDLRDAGFGDHGGEPATVLLKHGRIACGVGTDFGAPGAGHVRLNLGCAPEIVPEAVRRIAAAQQWAAQH